MRALKVMIAAASLVVFMTGQAYAQTKEETSALVASPTKAVNFNTFMQNLSVPEDQAKMLVELQHKADQGDSLWQEVLGYKYIAGDGAPVDKGKGEALLEKSAAQGNLLAKVLLLTGPSLLTLTFPVLMAVFSFVMTVVMMRKEAVQTGFFAYVGQSIKTAFENYATFSGRTGRSQYWAFMLVVNLLCLVDYKIPVLSPMNYAGIVPYFKIPFGLLSLTVFIPSLAMSVRRLHDSGKSGWRALLLGTGFGFLFLVVWQCQKGDAGANRFGGNPLTGDTTPPVKVKRDEGELVLIVLINFVAWFLFWPFLSKLIFTSEVFLPKAIGISIHHSVFVFQAAIGMIAGCGALYITLWVNKYCLGKVARAFLKAE